MTELLHMLLVASGTVVAVFGIAFVCVAIPCYGVRLRSAKSVVGSKPPANLRAFHAHGSVVHVRAAIEDFARRSGYTIAHTDELRGLQVLAGKPKGMLAPGLFFPVYLNQPAPDQVLVSVGCISPLSGLVFPGEIPKPDSKMQNDFMHQLAAAIVSPGHPAAPRIERAVPPQKAKAAVMQDAKPMPKNVISLKAQIAHGAIALALLGYGTYGLVVDEIIVPGKHGSIALHGWAAGLLYAAMLCAVLVLVSVIVDAHDERDNERYYHLFAHFFQGLGYLLFCAAIVVPMFVGSAPRDYLRDRARAEQGDAAAQYSVGRYLWYGDGVRQDFGEALDWLHKSAGQGDGDAMNLIGYMYEHGQGVRTNTLEAAAWYRRGVAAGSARAQNNLGLMYMELKIAPKNYAKGVEYLRMAAEQGHHRAMFNLGKAYRDGKGVEQSYPQAHAWFNLSVTDGFEYGTEYARSLESDMDADERREAQLLVDEWRRTHPRGR